MALPLPRAEAEGQADRFTHNGMRWRFSRCRGVTPLWLTLSGPPCPLCGWWPNAGALVWLLGAPESLPTAARFPSTGNRAPARLLHLPSRLPEAPTTPACPGWPLAGPVWAGQPRSGSSPAIFCGCPWLTGNARIPAYQRARSFHSLSLCLSLLLPPPAPFSSFFRHLLPPPQPPITRALGRSASALTKKISCREIRRQAPLLQAPQPFEPPAPPLFP